MTNIYEAISDWPVILQGALGSGAFWLLLVILQKIYEVGINQFNHISIKSRKSDLMNEKIKLATSLSKGEGKYLFAAVLLYRMFRPLLKSLLWLILGLLLGQVFSILSVVGFCGSIYYLLKAQNIIKAHHVENEGKAIQRLEEINIELEELERK